MSNSKILGNIQIPGYFNGSEHENYSAGSPTVSVDEVADELGQSEVQIAKPYLLILNGVDQGKRFELQKQINRIGRDEQADIVIFDPKISRDHAQLVFTPSEISIEDRNSRNGTYVDGFRITKTLIDANSRIRIGSTQMKLDIRDPKEALLDEALYEAAHTDPLTGVLNRRAFMIRANEALNLCRFNAMQIAVVMCDADHFKRINDSHTHPAGDYVLQEIARIIRESLRFEDLVARFGGEEFVILLRGINPQTALTRCNQIRTAIAKHPFKFQDKLIPCTLSMGICCREGDQIPDLDSLIQSADSALFKAKNKGRNRVEIL